MKLPGYLVMTLVAATFHLTLATDGNDLRAELCVDACYEAMHWDICARDSGCYSQQGQKRLLCMDRCLQTGVACQSTCWDSFDNIMANCGSQCPDADNQAQCRKTCFLREYANSQN